MPTDYESKRMCCQINGCHPVMTYSDQNMTRPTGKRRCCNCGHWTTDPEYCAVLSGPTTPPVLSDLKDWTAYVS